MSLTDSQKLVFNYVKDNGLVPTKEVAEAVDLSRRAVQDILCDLRKMGYLVRINNLKDMRVPLYGINPSVGV